MPRPADRPRTPERVTAPKLKPRVLGTPPVRRRNDISLRPDVVNAYKQHAFDLRITGKEWQNRAIRAFAKEVATNPHAYQPVPTRCTKCGHTINRVSDGVRRVHVTVDYESDLERDLLLDVADTYYHGVLAHAFDAACCFFLGKRAPKRVVAPRA